MGAARARLHAAPPRPPPPSNKPRPTRHALSSTWRTLSCVAAASLAGFWVVTLGGAAGLQREHAAGRGLASLHLLAVWVALGVAAVALIVTCVAVAKPAAARLPAVGSAALAYAGLLYVAIVASDFSAVGAGPRSTTTAVGACGAAAAALAAVAALGARPHATAGATGDALVPAFRRVGAACLAVGSVGWLALATGAGVRSGELAHADVALVLPTVGAAFWEVCLQAAAFGLAAVALWPPSAGAAYGRARLAAVGLLAAVSTMTLVRALPPYGPGAGGSLLAGAALCSVADWGLMAALGVRAARSGDADRSALPQRVVAIVGLVLAGLGLLAGVVGQLTAATAQQAGDYAASALTTVSLLAFAPQLVAVAIACVAISRATWLARGRAAAVGALAAAGGSLLFHLCTRERLAPSLVAGLALCVVGDLAALLALGWGSDLEEASGADARVTLAHEDGGEAAAARKGKAVRA